MIANLIGIDYRRKKSTSWVSFYMVLLGCGRKFSNNLYMVNISQNHKKMLYNLFRKLQTMIVKLFFPQLSATPK